MSQADLQRFLGRALLDTNYTRILMAVAATDHIDRENLRGLINALWPGQISRVQFDRFVGGPLIRIRPSDTHYYVHGAIRPSLLERFRTMDEYPRACRILFDNQTRVMARLQKELWSAATQEKLWSAAAQAALLELGFAPISARTRLEALVRIAPSRADADWVSETMRYYQVPSGLRR